jgi:hypothetical protein
MHRTTRLAFLGFLTTSFLGAQVKLAKLPSTSTDAQPTCGRTGEVLGRNVFAQTFLIRKGDGQLETVPFSRWTNFFDTSLDSRSERKQEIQPSDIQVGDRLCIQLDPSEATANIILVVKRPRAPRQPVKHAWPPSPSG